MMGNLQQECINCIYSVVSTVRLPNTVCPENLQMKETKKKARDKR